MKIFRTTPSYDRSAILREADRQRSRGKIRKAIREYERVLAVDPTDMDVHAKLAPLYIKAGWKERAKASLRRVIPWYEKQGFVDKAIATLRLALTLDRRDLAAHVHLADLYLEKRLAGDALKLLERARRAFRGKRYLKSAIAVEEKILSIAPDDFRAQVSIVGLLCRAGRKREARERLWRMEAEWAQKRNKARWRKTRWLLSRHAPSLSTSWGYFVALFALPAPYGRRTKARSSP